MQGLVCPWPQRRLGGQVKILASRLEDRLGHVLPGSGRIELSVSLRKLRVHVLDVQRDETLERAGSHSRFRTSSQVATSSAFPSGSSTGLKILVTRPSSATRVSLL